MIPTFSFSFFDVSPPEWRVVKDPVGWPSEDKTGEGVWCADAGVGEVEACPPEEDEEEKTYEIDIPEHALEDEEGSIVDDAPLYIGYWRTVPGDSPFPTEYSCTSTPVSPSASGISLPNPFPLESTLQAKLDALEIALEHQESLTDMYQRRWLETEASKSDALLALTEQEMLADLYQREWIGAEMALRMEQQVGDMHAGFWREAQDELEHERLAATLGHLHWNQTDDELADERLAATLGHLHWSETEDALSTEIHHHDLAHRLWAATEDALVDETISSGLAHEYWREAEAATSTQETVTAIMQRNWEESEEAKHDLLARNAELLEAKQALEMEVSRLISSHEDVVYSLRMDGMDRKIARAELELEVARLARLNAELIRSATSAFTPSTARIEQTIDTPRIVTSRKRKLSILSTKDIRSARIRLDSILDEPVTRRGSGIIRPSSAGPTLETTPFPMQGHLPAFIFPTLEVPFVAAPNPDLNSGGLSALEVCRRRGGDGRRDGEWIETQWSATDDAKRTKYEARAGLNRVAAARKEQERREKIVRDAAEIRAGWEVL